MYFEDIYNKIRPLWKDVFVLENIEETETYVKDIMEEFQKLGYLFDFSHESKYNEWESMLYFTMYQSLTAFAIEKWKYEKAELLNFHDVPITLFEECFRKNLEEEGNEEFLKKYKGFKFSPS